MITYGYVFGPSKQTNEQVTTTQREKNIAKKDVDRGVYVEAYDKISSASTPQDIAKLAASESIDYALYDGRSICGKEFVISTQMFSDFQESVTSKINNNPHRYLVYIPSLNGIPNSVEEKEFFRWLQENRKTREEAKESAQKYKSNGISLEEYSQYGQYYLDKAKEQLPTTLRNILNVKSAFFMDASVCAHPGVSVRYNPGDLVVIGFIDNAMDRPIILGELSNDAKEVSDAFICGIDNINTRQICATDYMEIPQQAKIKCKKEADELPEEYDIQQLINLLKALEQISIMTLDDDGGAQEKVGVDALAYLVRTLGPSIGFIMSLCENATPLLKLLQLTN